MIFQIKDAGKPGTGKFGLIPSAVRILMLQKPCDSALSTAGSSGPTVAKQTDQAPSGLRGSALPFAFQRRIVVGEDRLAKTAVRILDRAQPIRGALAVGLI